MSRSLILSPQAQRDIEEIADYTIAMWGVTRAKTYVGEIQVALKTLAKSPNIGRDCNFIRKGYRKYPVGSHMLFYRLIESGIDVIRILDQRMDVERNL